MPVDETILTTCPRDCYDACGIEVAIRDGVIRHVRGDRQHPVSRGRLCKKCATAYNGVLLDPGARLLKPLVREGRKGDGRFRRVSWDQALALIASRLSAIVAGAGAEKILNAHYTGTFAQLGYHFPMRFMRRLGATEVDPDTICNKSGHVALDYLYGTSEDGFDPRTAKDAACILVLGGEPFGIGATSTRALAARSTGTGGGRRLGAHRNRTRRGPAPAAIPGQRRGAGLRAGPRDQPRRPAG